MTGLNQTLLDAYDRCKQIARGHYENFPVGSLLVPKKLRPSIYALYAFMRTADDFADESGRTSEERLRLLAEWRQYLDRAIAAQLPSNPILLALDPIFLALDPIFLALDPIFLALDPIFLALQDTVSKFKLPVEPLYSLLDAFEFDAKGHVVFETFEDLHWYTRRSAEPVGKLVLALFGYRDEERILLSNDLCTALQLLNFLQDAKEDLQNERCYFPREDCLKFGIHSAEDILTSSSAGALVLYECDRIERLLANGSSLPERVNGRLKYELRAVLHGAKLMLGKIRAMEGETIRSRPKLTAHEQRAIVLAALLAKIRT
jgi:hydroxysqualene synthase